MGLQSPSVEKGLSIRDLQDPGPGATFGAIEEARLPVNVQKYFLDEILGFLAVPQNSAPHTVDNPSIATENFSQGLGVTLRDTF
jgi:hypothetical protein